MNNDHDAITVHTTNMIMTKYNLILKENINTFCNFNFTKVLFPLKKFKVWINNFFWMEYIGFHFFFFLY